MGKITHWVISDSQKTEVPGFDISNLPSQAFKYVTPHFVERVPGIRHVYLEAGPYVGTLPLLNGDTLYISPRAGRQSFSRMLLLSEGLKDAIRDEFEELARIGYESEIELPWSRILSRPFMTQLRIIERQSLMPSRIKEKQNRDYAKGKIRVFPTLLRLSKNLEKPIVCNYRTATYDNLENRLLATAAAVLYKLNVVESSDRRIASHWMERADGKWINESELRKVMVDLEAEGYAGSRSYYIPALLMARLILAQAGVALDERRTIEAEPILTDMPVLFEKYVRTVVMKALSEKGYVVEKVTGSRAPDFFTNANSKLEPDIVISSDGGVNLIADAKYKFDSSIDPKDHYQIFAYMDRFDTGKGLLIFPLPNETEFFITDRKLFSGKRILELRIPLNNWKNAEAILIENLEEILGS